MQLNLPKEIDRITALRYMGAGGWQPDAATVNLMDKAERELLRAATPRGVWRILPIMALPLEELGTDLQRHLDGCDEVALLGLTLGTGVDALLRKLELTDIALAATADAMSSVLLEQCADELLSAIKETQAPGRYLTNSYAPGYGDCPLTLNDEIALAADTVRGCGLSVTMQHLLTPRKSMTGVLGMANHSVTGTRAGCATCHLRNTCDYRKRGTTCGNDDT